MRITLSAAANLFYINKRLPTEDGTIDHKIIIDPANIMAASQGSVLLLSLILNSIQFVACPMELDSVLIYNLRVLDSILHLRHMSSFPSPVRKTLGIQRILPNLQASLKE